MKITLRSTSGVAGALVAVLFATNCAINPVTGRRELALVSEAQEIEMGREASREVKALIGLYPDQVMQGYVSALGQGIAKRTQRAALAWEYSVVDDAAVNAFALPGGFVFVTRGLLAQLTSEAQLAAVLGHESGHVAARHSVQQMSQQQLAALGIGLGSALSPFLAKYGEVAQVGAGLLMLKNSRDDETQADQLGFWYAIAEGYDTREMITLFEMLSRQAALGGRGRLPEWQSSHPDPEHRISDINHLVTNSTHDFELLRVDRDSYVRRLDGMKYGEDPRAGFFRGSQFLHPDFGFTVRFPEGWRTQNTPEAVTAISPAEDAIVQLRAADGSAAQSADRFLGQDGVREGRRSTTTIHGNRVVTAEFTVTDGAQGLQGLASFIEFGGRTWAMIGYSPVGRFEACSGAFQIALGSFQSLTDPVALAVQPRRIRITAAPRSMSLAAFQAEFPSSIAIDELSVLNGMTSTTLLRSGQPTKRVLGALPPR